MFVQRGFWSELRAFDHPSPKAMFVLCDYLYSTIFFSDINADDY